MKILARVILLVALLVCTLSYGQARQRGIIEFNTIADLKNTPVQPQDSDFAIVMSVDRSIEQLFNYEPTITGDEITSFALDNFTGSWVRVTNRQKFFHQTSGRFEIDLDYDWATWSDPNFGMNLQDWDLDIADSGVGGIPAIDWDGLGLFFPQGAILKRVFIKVIGNNNDIDVVEFYARAHDVDLLAGNPIDSNAEIGAVEVSNGIVSIDLDAGAGLANDARGFEVDLNDYTFVNAGDLHFYMKAQTGSLTANRQLRCTLFIEWELP